MKKSWNNWGLTSNIDLKSITCPALESLIINNNDKDKNNNNSNNGNTSLQQNNNNNIQLKYGYCNSESFIGCTCEQNDHGLCFNHKNELCPFGMFDPYQSFD